MSARPEGTGEKSGFTLVEVVIAAGLLGVFTVAAARPLQQAVMSATLTGDRAAATYYAAAGIEYGRGSSWAEFNALPVSTSNYWPDPARGVTYKRTLKKEPVVSPGLWRLEATVNPVLTSYLPGVDVKRLPTMLKPVKVVTLQSKWLLRDEGPSGNKN